MEGTTILERRKNKIKKIDKAKAGCQGVNTYLDFNEVTKVRGGGDRCIGEVRCAGAYRDRCVGAYREIGV